MTQDPSRNPAQGQSHSHSKSSLRFLILPLFFFGAVAALEIASLRRPPAPPSRGVPSPTATPSVSLVPDNAAAPTGATGPSGPSAAAAPLHKIPAQPASPAGAQDPRASDGRTVSFEVVEGNLAVAFGDVILGQVEEGSTARSGRYEPPALRLWDTPEIPYAIDASLPNPMRVEQAVAYFNEHTPVHFVQRTQETDALVFQPGDEHCYSALGRTGGLQPVRLSAGCQPQEIMHEMMHALGFVHEQSRPDRDSFVTILWDNIEPKYQTQFTTVPEGLMEAERGTAFDYHSIMLYRSDSFAVRAGAQTMRPAEGKPAIEPSKQGLSDGDISRLKRLYRVQ
jgi:hypothetical protein